MLDAVKVGEGAGAKGGERVGEDVVELAGEAGLVLVGLGDFGEDLREVEEEARAGGDARVDGGVGGVGVGRVGRVGVGRGVGAADAKST